MSLTGSIWLVVLAASLAANLPFLNERWLAVWPRRLSKTLWHRLLELVVLFFLVGGIARLLEGKLGDIQHQDWEFYAVNASLFVVFAYPGFVYRYLWRRRGA